jgi:hypothetical protein
MITADFPKIDYAYWLKNYSWEGFSSIRGMITTMINKKHIEPRGVKSNYFGVDLIEMNRLE